MRFAPRVPKDLIRRLHESEASGVLDEGLLEKAGTRFAMRCENMLAAEEATEGTVRCPRCGRGVKVTVPPGSITRPLQLWYF